MIGILCIRCGRRKRAEEIERLRERVEKGEPLRGAGDYKIDKGPRGIAVLWERAGTKDLFSNSNRSETSLWGA